MPRLIALPALAAVCALLVAACGDDDTTTPARSSPTTASEKVDGTIQIGGGRSLYARCAGSGSPTVVLEGGDEDTSDSYAYAETALAKVTRTCSYDRANLGRSGPGPGPRRLPELVGDLEALLAAAHIASPYVLVGTSGGGYITAGYAFAHPRRVAGLVFVDTAAPFRNPPPGLVKDTAWDNPANVEKRDYLLVEKQAWRQRRRIGDMPVRVITVDYGRDAEPFERRNVTDQQGWLTLSPRAKQIVVHTGHAVEEDDPQLVIDTILDVVREAQ